MKADATFILRQIASTGFKQGSSRSPFGFNMAMEKREESSECIKNKGRSKSYADVVGRKI